MMTWAQLGLHQKPIGILNVDGYYDSLIVMIQNMVEKGFVKETDQNLFVVSNTVDVLLKKMKNYVAPPTIKWINEETV